MAPLNHQISWCRVAVWFDHGQATFWKKNLREAAFCMNEIIWNIFYRNKSYNQNKFTSTTFKKFNYSQED